MYRIISTQIFRRPSIIISKKVWRDSYGRNTPYEGVKNLGYVKFDIIKILVCAEGLCLRFSVHVYLEFSLLCQKNFEGIPMGGTLLMRGWNSEKCKIRHYKKSGVRRRAMSSVFSAFIFRGPPIIMPKKFWRYCYGRNIPYEGMKI